MTFMDLEIRAFPVGRDLFSRQRLRTLRNPTPCEGDMRCSTRIRGYLLANTVQNNVIINVKVPYLPIP